MSPIASIMSEPNIGIFYIFLKSKLVKFTVELGFLQNLVLSHLAKHLGGKTKKKIKSWIQLRWIAEKQKKDKNLNPATLDSCKI